MSKPEERVIELGSKVRDRVTGFEGIAVARAIHLYMCDRYTVQPEVDKEGKMKDGLWIDGLALDVIAPPSALVKESLPEPQAKVGGPMEKAERR